MSGRFEKARKPKEPKAPREKKIRPKRTFAQLGWKKILLLCLNVVLVLLTLLCAAMLT